MRKVIEKHKWSVGALKRCVDAYVQHDGRLCYVGKKKWECANRCRFPFYQPLIINLKLINNRFSVITTVITKHKMIINGVQR